MKKYILKNALISISRNRGRNILIGIIVLVIASAATVALAINNSAASLIDSYASQYETEATISFNRENMMENFDPSSRDESFENLSEQFSEASNITAEEVEIYADSDYVSSYYYTLSLGVDSDDIEAASSDFGGGNENGGGNMPDSMGGGMNMGGEIFEISSGDFTLKGYSSLSAMTEFIEGSYTISSGAVSEDFSANDCIINSELATLNELEVGDTITFYNPDDSSQTITLNITGIFEENSAAETGGMMSMFSDSANTIITNTTVVSNFETDDFTASLSPTFVLTSSDVVDAFEAELREKGLSDSLAVETNLDQVESATSTIQNVQTFAVTFLIITLIIGTVVLTVLNLINLRERKYEIGVLRTIGMKKSLVSLQFITELCLVSLVALILGAGVGAAVSVPVSNSLLASEIESSNEATNQISANFGFEPGEMPSGEAPENAGDENVSGNVGDETPENGAGDMSAIPDKFQGVAEVQAFSSIDAVVDFKVLAELLVIGVLITLISSVGAMVSIQRFSPLTILKERS